MAKQIKVIFFGSGPYGNIALSKLIERNFFPDIVITKPDAPKGRGQKLSPNEVTKTAENSKIKVLKPEKLNDDFIEKIKIENPDLFLIVSYGKILSKKILEIPSFGTINIHPSLLPKHRGTSPLEAPFIEGENITGVTLMLLDEEMDHGPILIQDEFEIHPEMKKIDLGKILFEHGADMLIDNLENILNGKITPKEQRHNLATYTKKISKEDGLINLSKDEESWRKYRAYFGYPGVYFLKDKKRFKITSADFIDGKFVIKNIIPEGGKEVLYSSMLNK